MSDSKTLRNTGFTYAADFGFSPEATGIENLQALQRAVDQTGTIIISRPGTYRLAGTVYVPSDTHVKFGAGVFIQKVDEQGPFCHVMLNKGAPTRTTDRRITIEGLHVIVNDIDHTQGPIYGLQGQLAFFHVEDLHIERFRCYDLGHRQFAIQICTFEDIAVTNVIIHGNKDGVHLGRGKRFVIRDGVFKTVDDAIALNAHDYATSNPELGWIEDGVIENCTDLPDDHDHVVGFFCRILAGGWGEWKPGMPVQHSDSVIHNDKLYRVMMKPDEQVHTSNTPPTHDKGKVELDGITWGMVQEDVTYTAGVRNVVFRDITLRKPRTSFSVHFDGDKWSRSYYPGSPVPVQEQLLFENVRVLHDEPVVFLNIGTPVDVITVSYCSLKNNRIRTHCKDENCPHPLTMINMIGCIFNHHDEMTLVSNELPGRFITLQTSASVIKYADFSARIKRGGGAVKVASDLPGLGG